MEKFSETITYPKLHRYEGLIGRVPVRYPNIYLGIEVEAENISGGVNIPGSWKSVEDGSLKVNGMEFITVPIKFVYLEMELRRLFGAIPNAAFSPRTSIHVHMNARDFTVDDLHKFLLLYMIFEKSLYKFSGDRWTNNFCVPVYETPKHMPAMLHQLTKDSFIPNWSKYMGLNLLPLTGSDGVGKIGTIEFRHMSGNNNVEYIMDWCNLITCLKFAARKMDGHSLIGTILNHETINTSFIYNVFGKWANLIYKDPEWERNISSCTSKTKFVMYKSESYGMSGPKVKAAYGKASFSLDDIINQHNATIQAQTMASEGHPTAIPIPVNPFAIADGSVDWNIWNQVPQGNNNS